MQYIREIMDAAVLDFENSYLGQGAFATINTDTGTDPWTVSVAMSSTALVSTDLPSAYDEADAWFLTLGYKRLSIWGPPGYQAINCLVSV